MTVLNVCGTPFPSWKKRWAHLCYEIHFRADKRHGLLNFHLVCGDKFILFLKNVVDELVARVQQGFVLCDSTKQK